MTQTDPDLELVLRIGRGDRLAIQAFVARKLPRLMALATRMLGNANDAEDVTQEVFVRVWRKASDWRPGEARFDTWMHRVALNLCLDQLRRHAEKPVAEVPDQADPDTLPGAKEGSDAADRVAMALKTLAPRQREAIVLTYYQELNNDEAATVMEISVEALESLLSRGRRALRDWLKEHRHE